MLFRSNINSVCIGDYHRPKVRLIGPVLQPEHMTLFGREYIMMAHHDTRRFVEKVDFISGVGYPGGLAGRHELGLETGGPELVFTPKRSEEHTSELQSLMRISYAVFCLKKKKTN